MCIFSSWTWLPGKALPPLLCTQAAGVLSHMENWALKQRTVGKPRNNPKFRMPGDFYSAMGGTNSEVCTLKITNILPGCYTFYVTRTWSNKCSFISGSEIIYIYTFSPYLYQQLWPSLIYWWVSNFFSHIHLLDPTTASEIRAVLKDCKLKISQTQFSICLILIWTSTT